MQPRPSPSLAIYFYPRSPCGERLVHRAHGLNLLHISIHALLAESDVMRIFSELGTDISIHALLAESDLKQKSFCLTSN